MQSARGFEYGVRHIISPQSGRLCDVLLSTLDLTMTEIEFLLDLGSVYLNHKRVTENFSISQGDYLRVHTKPRRFLPNDEQWGDRIIYENEHFLVANKLSSLPVHASVDNLRENLQVYLEKYLNCKLLVTHRLDVPTRGLIVYAKTAVFQTAFNKLLATRDMNKIYRAIVEGQGLKPGVLRHYMESSPRAPKTVSSQLHEGWQECLLEILTAKEISEDRSELKIQLMTGRTHQIRAQMGYEKHPVVGDHTYGAKKIWDEEKIELEACELDFTNPLTGELLHFKL